MTKMRNLFIILFSAFMAASVSAQVNATMNNIQNAATSDVLRIEFTSTTTLTGIDLAPINVFLKIPGDGAGVSWTVTSNPFGLVDGSSFAFGGYYYRVFQSLTPQSASTFPMGVAVTVAEITITGFDGAVELMGGEFGAGVGSNVPGTALVQGTTNLLNWPISLSSSLPIALREFDVIKKGNDGAQLDWITSTEENTSHFEVERSANGQSWTKVGIVEAVGNSTIAQKYRFNDIGLKHIPNDDRIFYYRLRAVDLNSRFEYSKVKQIELNYDNIEISVHPNPTSDGVWIRLTHPRTNSAELSYNLVDINGKTIMANTLGNNQEISEYLPLSQNMPAGTYMLNITTEAQILRTERIVLIGER